MPSADRQFWSRRRIGVWALTVFLGLLVMTMVRLEASLTEVAPVDLELDGPGTNVDDPCFWVDPVDPSRSLIFITTKDSELVEVFGAVTGEFVTSIPGFGLPNNCVVEGNLLLTTDRGDDDVKVHQIPELTLVNTFGQDMNSPEGIDVLDTPEGQHLVYVTNSRDASVHVYDLATGALVHSFSTGFGDGIEPILADDLYQRIYVGRGEKESKRGIGLFEPDGTLLFEFGAEVFSKDAEGMAVYACGDGGYLIAADQRSDATHFEVFDRVTLEHMGAFMLQDGRGDFTDSTDGIDILQTPLPGWPNGILAACDGCGATRPDEMDVISWDRIASAAGLDLCPDGEKPDCGKRPCTKRVTASADAFVSGAEPNTNFGSAGTLEIELDPPSVRETLLRVEVPDLMGFEILEAVLRLKTSGVSSAASDDGGTLFVTTGDWTESGVTFNNRPAPIGEPVDSAGAVGPSEEVDFNVTEVVLGPGSYDFLLVSASVNKALYYSREANLGQPTLTLLVQGSPPEVAITSPDDDSSIEPGTPLVLSATADDGQQGDLSFAITWSSNLDGELGEGSSLTVSSLSVGSHTITAEVTDETGLAGSASVLVLVNTAPELAIAGPADGTMFETGHPVPLTGAADDAEEGDLSAQITWTSDLDGLLGTGGGLSIATLHAGTHTITASVTDAAGESASDQVTVIINSTPKVAIAAPADGSVFSPGETVGLAGTAVDAEDGDLAAAMRWTSDLDGALGTGGSVATSSMVTSGTHTLTARVVDSIGKEASHTITVIVNAFPTVQITAPANGSVFEPGETVGFAGAAADREDGDLSSQIAWTSDIEGPLGTGGTPQCDGLSSGTHTITAAVADSGQRRASATITVIVNASPAVQITSPVDGSIVNEGEAVGLMGAGTDAEDGDLGAAISWTSDIDGPLGTGGSITTSALVTPGPHKLTAEVVDSGQKMASATVTVTVNSAPTVRISEPAGGMSLAGGAPLTLEATAVDSTDGDLGSALDWVSDRDGHLGTGPSLVVILSEGTHVLAAEVADSNGAVGREQVTVVVTPTAPVLTITAPHDGLVILVGGAVRLEANAQDFADGDLSAAIAWESDMAGRLGTGASLEVSGLLAGTHAITASVTDSGFLTARASVRVTVIAERMELEPEADAYVDSGVPDANFGAASTLQADASPERQVFLRFAVTGTAGALIERAVLRLTVSIEKAADSERGGTLHVIGDTGWEERKITYRSRPPIDGPVLGIQGPVAKGQVVEFDVTPAIAGDGYVAFAVLTTSSDAVKYKSRENASGRPALALTLRVPEVPDGRPALAITAPLDGSAVVLETPVTFSATAMDAEDGDLSGSIAWSSDLAGHLGVGSPLTVPGLPAGEHVIRADVVDSDGLPASAEITILSNAPPVVTILSPPDGTVPEAGVPVTFTARAADPEDGDLSAAIIWESDLQGQVGTGGTVVVNALALGTHVITASAADSSLLTGQASVRVAVIATTMEFEPEADAYVDSSLPNGNFGAASTLQADASPVRQVFLRFAVTGVAEALIDQAILRLAVSDEKAADSERGGTLHAISDTGWQEGTITYGNRPPIDGPVLGSQGRVAMGDIVEFDVAPAIAGDGYVVFAILTTSSDAVKYRSREMPSGRPTLVLDLRLPEVLNEAPTVAVAAPQDGTVAQAGTPVTLAATASDSEDGDLSGEIVWLSDRDGLLGTGGTLSATLSTGAHLITASVVDSAGAAGSASARVSVVDEPPVVTILTPAEARVVSVGSPVLLSGTAVDALDGDLSARLTWVSSLDGALGVGPSLLVATLSVGQHEITASVVDSGGNRVTASVSVTVTLPSFVFDTLADAFVVQSAPDSRFGADTHLIVKGDGSAMQVFLRFQVSGIQGREVRGAKLRLTVDTPSSAGSVSGGQIHAVSDVGWDEMAITYNNRPGIDEAVLYTAGPVKPRDVVEFDVTPAITADGVYGFALVSMVADATVYRSREAGSGGPQLIVTYGSD